MVADPTGTELPPKKGGDLDEYDPMSARLHMTTDARVWATEFMAVVEGGATVDVDLMVTWFANALESGRAVAVAW